MKTAFAIGAHPDDIEFQTAGTLLLLKKAGYEIHYMNVANGNCGSVEYDRATAARIRLKEGKAAARILGAHFHAPLCNDLEIIYDLKTLRRLSAVIREVKPSIVLTHSPQDYMEDHTNTCRLVVSAAFTHGMPNFKSQPSRTPYGGEVTLYHWMPHSSLDPLRRAVVAGAYVNTASVHATKRAALAAHQSQQGWLDASQGMNSYLQAMETMSLNVGKASRRFKHAEGFRRHLHFGYSANEIDPFAEALGKNYYINKAYEKSLKLGF